MKKIIIAAALSLAAAVAHAETPLNGWDAANKWFHFDRTPNADLYMSAPTQNADGTKSIWVRADYSNGTVISGESIWKILLHVDINCAASTSRAGAEIQYGPRDEVVRSTNTLDDWAPNAPGTIADEEHGFICQKAGK